MKTILFFLLSTSSVLLANEQVSSGETDIFYRTINFLIFVAIAYYYVADQIKAIFTDRRVGIANELELIQVKLRESKQAKVDAKAKEFKAQSEAEKMLKDFEAEKALINKKINEQNQKDLVALQIQFSEQMKFEKLKMIRTVVEDILKEVVSDASSPLTPAVMKEILVRKVA
jgi:F-type H+-transporting ATPase subunit b